jgi:hypothetical protein
LCFNGFPFAVLKSDFAHCHCRLPLLPLPQALPESKASLQLSGFAGGLLPPGPNPRAAGRRRGTGTHTPSRMARSLRPVAGLTGRWYLISARPAARWGPSVLAPARPPPHWAAAMTGHASSLLPHPPAADEPDADPCATRAGTARRGPPLPPLHPAGASRGTGGWDGRRCMPAGGRAGAQAPRAVDSPRAQTRRGLSSAASPPPPSPNGGSPPPTEPAPKDQNAAAAKLSLAQRVQALPGRAQNFALARAQVPPTPLHNRLFTPGFQWRSRGTRRI